MKHNIEKETLTLFFEGKINSSNAEDVEKEVDEALKKGDFKAVRIDMGDVEYISSAGLRIIVRIKQQYDDTVLIRVPSSVYSVFEMVGFPKLIKIERK